MHPYKCNRQYVNWKSIQGNIRLRSFVLNEHEKQYHCNKNTYREDE